MSLVCLRCLRRSLSVQSLLEPTSPLTSLACQRVQLAHSWVKREAKRKLKDEIVFQYASKNTKRADRVYVWGYAAAGALGIRRFSDPNTKGASLRLQQHIPCRLVFMDKHNLKTHQVACGYGFSVFLCSNEKRNVVYGTGINTDSQLGFQPNPQQRGASLDYLIEPTLIELPLLYPDATKIQHVGCGRAHTVICTDKEGVITLGHNGYGQCGRPIVDDEEYRGSQVINRVSFPHSVAQVECGQDHTLLLTEQGQVYSFGLSSDGQTGHGHYGLSDKPTLVGGDIAGEKIVHISSRADCVLAVSDKGEAFGWGNSEYNQLTVVERDQTQVNVPRHLPFTGIGKVTRAAAAGSMCALLNDEGDVFVWGFGVLGKGPLVEESSMPTRVPPILFGRNDLNPHSTVTHISCGINNFAAITDMGDLYMWGNNTTAHLGLGHCNKQFFPFKVLVPAEVRQVVCGVDHTVTLAKGFA